VTVLHDEWDDDTGSPTPQAAAGDSQAPAQRQRGKKGRRKKAPPPLMYQTLGAWVEEYLAPMIRRKLGHSLLWCPQWWKHPEALSRLGAMWRAWEHLRHDPALGMSTWWVHHADPHLRELMHDQGPFAACSPTKGHSAYSLKPLPVDPPDPKLWLHPAFSTPPQGDGDGT
jgi:Domain of unknown function (DUF4913)